MQQEKVDLDDALRRETLQAHSAKEEAGLLQGHLREQHELHSAMQARNFDLAAESRKLHSRVNVMNTELLAGTDSGQISPTKRIALQVCPCQQCWQHILPSVAAALADHARSARHHTLLLSTSVDGATHLQIGADYEADR